MLDLFKLKMVVLFREDIKINDMESDGPIKITYDFFFPDNISKTYLIEINRETLDLVSKVGTEPPEWTRLDFHKCSHCPLKTETTPHCPIALNLSHLVEDFADKNSFEQVNVRVTTEERMYAKKVDLQTAIFSMFGLVMATSSCPYTTFLKPMARFHLPFSNSEETNVRSISMYLLRQYFVAKNGGEPDLKLKKLDEHYSQIQKVNTGILARIKAVAREDAQANAITVLHSLATLLTMALSSDLEKLESLFTKT